MYPYKTTILRWLTKHASQELEVRFMGVTLPWAAILKESSGRCRCGVKARTTGATNPRALTLEP